MTYNMFGGTLNLALSIYLNVSVFKYSLNKFRESILHQGCIKCKLALHGLAAYLLNSLQQCSSLQSRRKQRSRLLILIYSK